MRQQRPDMVRDRRSVAAGPDCAQPGSSGMGENGSPTWRFRPGDRANGRAVMSYLFEIGIVVFLLILNGWFAMSEMAIVSSRRARLEAMAEQGSRGRRPP